MPLGRSRQTHVCVLEARDRDVPPQMATTVHLCRFGRSSGDMGLARQSSVTWRWQQTARMSGETGFLGLSLGPLEPPQTDPGACLNPGWGWPRHLVSWMGTGKGMLINDKQVIKAGSSPTSHFVNFLWASPVCFWSLLHTPPQPQPMRAQLPSCCISRMSANKPTWPQGPPLPTCSPSISSTVAGLGEKAPSPRQVAGIPTQPSVGR